MNRRVLGVLSTVVAVALVAGTVAWTRVASDAPREDVATAPVVRGDIEDVVAALGTLQPHEFVDVGTQVSGQLKRVAVQVGANVPAGAVVAEIDTAVLAAKLQADQALLQGLEAQIVEKQAQHGLATRQHQRNATMFARDAVSRDAVETSLAAAQVAAAQVDALKAQREQTRATLRIAETQLGYAKIRAPIAGTVVSLNAREGQTLNASQSAPTLMRVARLDTMTVVAQVSEADVVRLAVGTPVYFHTLGRADRRWSGKVRQILPTPETLNNVVLYQVLFDVDNADRSLMTQMSAQVYFVLARASHALIVPAAALEGGARKAAVPAPDDATDEARVASRATPRGAAPAVAAAPAAAAAPKAAGTPARVRVLEDGRVQERSIVVGVVNRKFAQVLSGLAEGEQVVLKAPPAGKAGKSKGTS